MCTIHLLKKIISICTWKVRIRFCMKKFKSHITLHTQTFQIKVKMHCLFVVWMKSRSKFIIINFYLYFWKNWRPKNINVVTCVCVCIDIWLLLLETQKVVTPTYLLFLFLIFNHKTQLLLMNSMNEIMA